MRGFAAMLAVLLSACGGGVGSTPAAPVNAAPSANAGPDVVLQENDTVSVTGSGADSDGGVQSFRWRQVSGPAARLTGAASATLRVTAPLVQADADLVFELTVTDNAGARGTDHVTLTTRPAATPSRLEVRSRHGGRDRLFTVYTPPSYAPGAPALLLLHGGGGTMRQVIGDNSAAEWLNIVDREGWLLIAPNGFDRADGDGLGDSQSWNDLRPDDDRISNADDAGFLLSVLDIVGPGRGFDPDSVYVTGSSNGGMMSMRMLIEHGDRFAAAASFIGGLPEVAIPDPLSPAPIFIYAGTLDPLVLFGGGPVSGDRPGTRSIADTVDYWVRINGLIASDAVQTALPDTDAGDGCHIIETLYPATPGGSTVVAYYEAVGGGHSMPDPTPPVRAPAIQALLGPQCRDAHGVDLAFAFFDQL